MSEHSLSRKRTFRTFRLFPQDRELLLDLGRGRPKILDRHAALLDMNSIAEEMDVPQQEQRNPIRIGIPTVLMNTLSRRAKESGRTFQDVLLMAARHYRKKYPLPKSENRKNDDAPESDGVK